jgi:hypothetical protein
MFPFDFSTPDILPIGSDDDIKTSLPQFGESILAVTG